MKIIITKNINHSKRKIEVHFPNGRVERFGTIFKARKFVESCRKNEEVIEIPFEKTPRPIKNNRWQ